MTPSKFRKATFWVAATFALVMALLPHPPEVPGNPSDKVQHIIAFAVLAGLLSASYPQAKTTTHLILLSAFGALIEVLQAIPVLHRNCDWVDWADTIAVSAVLLAATLWQAMSEQMHS